MRVLSAVLLAATLTACSALSGLDDFSVADAGGAGPVSVTTTSTGGGGSATSSTAGGGAGTTNQLTDEGLVARYFLESLETCGPVDDDDDGFDCVRDAAPDPLPLRVARDDDAFPRWVDNPEGHLFWDEAGRSGGPIRGSVVGTKLADRLNGAVEATLEVVVLVDGATGMGSRLVHFGRDESSGRLTLRTGSPSTMNLFVNDDIAASAPVPAGQRIVVHGVYPPVGAGSGRAPRFYVDGSAVATTSIFDRGSIDLSDCHFAIGNRMGAGRSIHGRIYYAAVYAEALSDERIAAHAARLAESNDP
ncbi:MAG: LamG-like jellyroll fold domain-containing protein [Myxococcota bacterium]